MQHAPTCMSVWCSVRRALVSCSCAHSCSAALRISARSLSFSASSSRTWSSRVEPSRAESSRVESRGITAVLMIVQLQPASASAGHLPVPAGLSAHARELGSLRQVQSRPTRALPRPPATAPLQPATQRRVGILRGTHAIEPNARSSPSPPKGCDAKVSQGSIKPDP